MEHFTLHSLVSHCCATEEVKGSIEEQVKKYFLIFSYMLAVGEPEFSQSSNSVCKIYSVLFFVLPYAKKNMMLQSLGVGDCTHFVQILSYSTSPW